MILLQISYRKFKYILLFALTIIAIVYMINNSTTILRTHYPVRYKDIVDKYARENGVDPYLIFAVIKAESSFNPKAISSRNARGLMQITESTAYEGAEKLNIENFTLDALYDPETNIRIGVWYLGWLSEQFNGNQDLMITAYNGGIGNVKEWLSNKELSSNGKSLDRIPFKETEKFLERVRNNQGIYLKLYKKDTK